MGVALLSVSDKDGIAWFAKQLTEHGFEIISTGGTAKLLGEEGVTVASVEQHTGSPEILGGRVKTLHPNIHGGILARRDKDMTELEMQAIEPIDMVVVNLYPFQKTVDAGAEIDEAVEQIDIGGVALLRAAAKNYKDVIVVCDPKDYQEIIDELAKGGVTPETKKRLAVKAFHHTAHYDAAIHTHLSTALMDDQVLHVHLHGGTNLRYGENPHQEASFYRDGTTGIGTAEQLHGKQLSYNNYLDGDAALNVVRELDEPAAVVVKHCNPCGIATGRSLREALEAAWGGDIVSAFGSVIAFSQKVDIETAEFLKGKFVEMVIAPDYDEDALSFLKGKSKKLRIMKVTEYGRRSRKEYRHVSGGILEQTPDEKLFEKWECVTATPFPEEKEPLARFTTIACKNTKSNAVILGIEYAPACYKVLGMGAGQPNRVDSLRKLAVTKANENIERDGGSLSECVLVSDAFFPFDDTVREAAEYGIKYVVQPGGSIRDGEVIGACNELGVAMICTGTRHFRH